MLAILALCHPRLRLVLATNATSRLPDDLRRLGLADRFDAIANSSELGEINPSPSYFLSALRLANTCTTDALFVDDTSVSVQAADALGIRSHHFTGYEGFARFLGRSGALDQPVI